MSLAIVLAGIGLIVLPSSARHQLERLRPTTWCRISSISLRFGLGLLQFGLAATAAPTLFRMLGVDQAAEACSRALGPVPPGGALTGTTAMVLLSLVVAARRRGRRHARRTIELVRIEPWLGTHVTLDGIDYVTLPSDRPLAYAVPGATPQVVVSERLPAELTADEFAAVLRHETSHLRHQHHRHLTLACEIDTSFGWLTAARRSTATLRLAVERVADEDAITTSEHRSHVRSALVKTATSLVTAVPTFTPLDTVTHRLAALDRPPNTAGIHRLTSVAVMIVPLATATAGATAWILASHHLLLGYINLCFG